jgi:hypothetical protein
MTRGGRAMIGKLAGNVGLVLLLATVTAAAQEGGISPFGNLEWDDSPLEVVATDQ